MEPGQSLPALDTQDEVTQATTCSADLQWQPPVLAPDTPALTSTSGVALNSDTFAAALSAFEPALQTEDQQAYTVSPEPGPGRSAHKQCLDAIPSHHPPGMTFAGVESAPMPLPPTVPGPESKPCTRALRHFSLTSALEQGRLFPRQLGVSTLAIDPLLDSRMDLRDDAFFDRLLRICASKSVALAHAAPPCGEYTRARLLPHGPRALRTPEALNGIPGLCPADALKVQESHLVFTRCVQLLFVTFSSGGQVSLEQPTNSMAWLEPLASHFLREIQVDLVNVAACSVGLDMHKSWLFATFASICEHPQGSHEDIRGTRDSSGGFRSRASAEYPDILAQRYAQQVKGLFPSSASGSRISLDSAPLLSRLKTPSEPPVSVQDGAGIFSVPDWSVPPPDAKDVFAGLRPRLLDFLLRNRLPGRLRYLCDLQSSEPLFQLRGIFELWLQSLPGPRQVSWTVAEGQPSLQLVSALTSDRDTALFPCLLSGGPTGFDADIPLSNACASRLWPPLCSRDCHLPWQLEQRRSRPRDFESSGGRGAGKGLAFRDGFFGFGPSALWL